MLVNTSTIWFAQTYSVVIHLVQLFSWHQFYSVWMSPGDTVKQVSDSLHVIYPFPHTAGAVVFKVLLDALVVSALGLSDALLQVSPSFPVGLCISKSEGCITSLSRNQMQSHI